MIMNKKKQYWSLSKAIEEQGLQALMKKLYDIITDVTDQYSRQIQRDDFWHLKVRGLHAFQCQMMLLAIEDILKEDPGKKELVVVDIGDSSGNHMLYLKGLLGKDLKVRTISVNLDPVAVEKIKKKGLEALLCRAEELRLPDGQTIDLFVSFEMLEHLHNPIWFLYRLAKLGQGERLLITVPYQRVSRMGLYTVRFNRGEKRDAEHEHIFELCPEDWKLLMKHSGWEPVFERVYYQYPRKIPFISEYFSKYWRKTDFEGFWGVYLKRNLKYAELYTSWPEV